MPRMVKHSKQEIFPAYPF